MRTQTDAARTSGTSPGRRTIHLLGAGNVVLEILRRIAQSRYRLVAVTDSTGTIATRAGLDARQVARWKQDRRVFAAHPDRIPGSTAQALRGVAADIVIDATSSDARPYWAAQLEHEVLERGNRLVLVAKNALNERAAAWLTGRYAGHIGCNAVLGGTGDAFARELVTLRERCTSALIVGNASTSAIIAVIEQGGSLTDGISAATTAGYLESDPELDLRGADAAAKLAIVAGALRGRAYDATSIPCEDIRHLEPTVLRARVRRGCTTRLVARLHQDGDVGVAYEAIPTDAITAVPPGRVVYEYTLANGDRRIHIGEGLGAALTAGAAWLDVQRVATGIRPLAFAGGAL